MGIFQRQPRTLSCPAMSEKRASLTTPDELAAQVAKLKSVDTKAKDMVATEKPDAGTLNKRKSQLTHVEVKEKSQVLTERPDDKQLSKARTSLKQAQTVEKNALPTKEDIAAEKAG